jgi:hypothetical protein
MYQIYKYLFFAVRPDYDTRDETREAVNYFTSGFKKQK